MAVWEEPLRSWEASHIRVDVGWLDLLFAPFPLLHTLKSPCQLEPWWHEEVFATCLPCSGASASPTVVPINTTPFLKLWCHTLTKQVGPSQWCLPKIPAFRKLRQENSCEIEGQPGLWCISPLQTNNPQIKKTYSCNERQGLALSSCPDPSPLPPLLFLSLQ